MEDMISRFAVFVPGHKKKPLEAVLKITVAHRRLEQTVLAFATVRLFFPII